MRILNLFWKTEYVLLQMTISYALTYQMIPRVFMTTNNNQIKFAINRFCQTFLNLDIYIEVL